MKAVVVEDDEVSLKVVEKILEKHDIEHESHRNAINALNYFQQGGEADIVISDIMMPEMNGFDLVKKLRDQKRTKKLPVILCTALNDQASVLRGIKLGISDYVTKPVNEQTLIDKIEKAIKSMRTILIVDPEKTIGDLIDNILHNNGIYTARSANGEEAIKTIEEKQIALVITAIDLPDISGEELLKTVKQKNSKIPVMVITGFDGNHNKKDILNMGADGIIKKPFHNIDILKQIKKLSKA